MHAPQKIEAPGATGAVFYYILVLFLCGLPLNLGAAVEWYAIPGEDVSWETLLQPSTNSALPTSVDFATRPGSILPVRNSIGDTSRTHNLALKVYDLGGSVDAPNVFDLLAAQRQTELRKMLDGDTTTAFQRVQELDGRHISVLGTNIELDLGRRMGVNLLRLYPRPGFTGRAWSQFDVQINDGTPETADRSGRPILVPTRQIVLNAQDTVDVPLGQQYIRYFRLISRTNLEFEIAELELYGEGYLPEAVFRSQPIDFGGPVALGKIEWQEEIIGDPDASQLIIRVHTGSDSTPFVYWRSNSNGDVVPWMANARAGSGDSAVNLDDFSLRDLRDEGGRFVALETYNALTSEEKEAVGLTLEGYRALGASQLPFTSDSNWSGLQPVENGRQIGSPGERQFLQFEIEFKSRDFEAATAVNRLAFEFSLEVGAQQIAAEIEPAIDVAPGQITAFTYGLQPVFNAEDAGFNRLEISTPTKVAGVDSLFIGGRKLQEGADFEVISVSERAFVVGFPQVDLSTAAAAPESPLVRLHFRTMVLGFGTRFSGRVFRVDDAGEIQGLPQRLVPGDAGDLGPGDANALAVALAVPEKGLSLLDAFDLSPKVFTPNGDGVNDEVVLTYNLLRLTRARPVAVEIFDLSGRRIRAFPVVHLVSGRYTQVWGGEDAAGAPVAPGIYVVQLVVKADAERVVRDALVHVAY